MTGAYYNEHDAAAAAWLRELMRGGHIASGDVDERPIQEVQPDDIQGYTQAHFFAGIGGWPYALRLAGWPDDRPIWTGSCPCQPFSAAGARKGGADDRHLWPYWARFIGEWRPAVVLGEQVASAIAHGWLDAVFDDLEGWNYACGAAVLPAASVGAFHRRDRVWFVADAGGERAARHAGEDGGAGRPSGAELHDGGKTGDVGDGIGAGLEGLAGRGDDGHEPRRHGADTARPVATAGQSLWANPEWIVCRDGKSRPTQSGIFPLVDGLSRGVVRSGDPGLPGDANRTPEARVMRLRGYGNAIVPQVAAAFIGAYLEAREVERWHDTGNSP